MTLRRCPTPHYSEGRAGERPLGVVLHTNVGSFESTVTWFARADSRVSAHYLVALDGRVAQFVDEADTARHAGRVHAPTTPLADHADPNLVTIGLEFEDGGDPEGVARTDVQYARGAELVAAIAERWGIPVTREYVVGHREIYAHKSCPGNLDIDRIVAAAGG